MLGRCYTSGLYYRPVVNINLLVLAAATVGCDIKPTFCYSSHRPNLNMTNLGFKSGPCKLKEGNEVFHNHIISRIKKEV